MDVRVAVARWSLDRLAGEELPDIASALLLAGHDGPALRELAGLVRPTLRDASDLLDRAMSESGVSKMPSETAFGVLAWHVAHQIVNRQISAYSGACELCGLASDSSSLPELFVFHEFTDEYSGYTEGPDLDEAIRGAAREFLANHPDLAAQWI